MEDNKEDKQVRVRIAPSPTGAPHLGTAYVALFNYAFARHHGGQFILRIEDTDQARSSRESEDAIMHSLRWLGLEWDEGPDKGGDCGPYRQSERAALYLTHAGMLVDRGHAYRCFCTPERLTDLRTTQRLAKASFMGYDGQCRLMDPEEAERRAEAGETHVVRLKMDRAGTTVLRDGIRGNVEIRNDQSDDQVLIKSDGLPTYHLANVVDDHSMGVSHVIRAEEWISSAPKHIRLYEAFGWEQPVFMHLPLLRNNDKNKSKISKRRNPVSLEYHREAGFLPEAVLNFLALMGWSFGEDREKFSLEEMVERFDLSARTMSLSGPVFDLEKMAWLNGLYIRELSDEQLLERLLAWQLGPDYLARLMPLARERIRRLDEFIPLTEYFFAGDLDYEPMAAKLVPKKRTPKETAKMLGDLLDRLDNLRQWTPEALEPVLRGFCEEKEWKPKEVFSVARIAVTGRTAAPSLFDTMVVVGRERCRWRLRQAMTFIKQHKA